MNIGNYNGHNSSFDTTKIIFFTLFRFLTQLRTFNHLNRIRT